MNLFQEVSTKPDTGSSMNYTSNLSHLVSYWYGPTAGLARGPPFYSTIYVNNTMENTEIWFFPISGETKHEIGHDLFSSPRHSLDKNHKMVGGGGGYISLDEGKSIRITYSLPDLQDMSIYKED
jgi:hypothetical protein